MKLVFASNFFNHHQKPLSDALAKMEEVEYHFLSFSPMPDERKNMGYDDHNDPAYVIRAYESEEAGNRCQQMIDEADAVIYGSAPPRCLLKRVWNNKPVLYYSERPLKKGNQILKFIPRWVRWHIRYPNSKQIYLLCASAYTAGDYAKFGLFKNKTYKWGYFPETVHYESIEDTIAQKEKKRILWCGRFLDWKHPDDAVRLAKRLKDGGHVFSLDMIGTGEMEPQLKRMISELDLEDCVRLLGPMPPEQVRSHMEQAGIYLLTSDRKEGWGAVVNEAMNSGCAVIGSHAAGSVPFLIQDNINGCVYLSGDGDMLYEKTAELLTNTEKQQKLGRNAYETIVSLWNAETAAKRLIVLAESILQGDKFPKRFETGPCSEADWL